MRQSVDFAWDDHPEGDEDRPRSSWIVMISQTCDACGDPRVELIVEEADRRGSGLGLHMAPATVRRLRAALAKGLRDIGEPVDEPPAPQP